MIAAVASGALLVACASALRLPPTASPEPVRPSPAQAPPQSPAAPDADLVRGIDLYRNGEYDQAVLLLDGVARRLTASPARSKDLAQAYFFMGAANLGLAQEVQARARFRDALAADPSLRPSPYEFSPTILNVFEAVREQLPAAAPAPSPSPAAAGAPDPDARISVVDKKGKAQWYPFTPGMTVRQLIDLSGAEIGKAQQFLVFRPTNGGEKRFKVRLDSTDLKAGDMLLVESKIF